MELRNVKHPHYPAGMIVNVPEESGQALLSSGFWERVDATSPPVALKKKYLCRSDNKVVFAERISPSGKTVYVDGKADVCSVPWEEQHDNTN